MHTPGNKAMFGALGDSALDTWGRVLIRRPEPQAALAEPRTPRTLGEADYLLGVCDEARQGALLFRLQADGQFLASSGPHAVPPLVDLARLLSSSDRVTSGDADSQDLRLLLAPGSSMGGPGPRLASVIATGNWCSPSFRAAAMTSMWCAGKRWR